MIEAYPLQWPSGRPRTRLPMGSRFEQTNGRAISFALHQINLLGGFHPVISSNIELGRDGMPDANGVLLRMQGSPFTLPISPADVFCLRQVAGCVRQHLRDRQDHRGPTEN